MYRLTRTENSLGRLEKEKEMNTITNLANRYNVEPLDHLLDENEVPVLTGPQRQGDIMVIPQRAGKIAGLVSVPSEGYPVVRGENGGNTHLLLAEGDVQFSPSSGGQRLGSLLVGEGSVAWLSHPEHGFNGIGAGSYIITRQREQADQIRLIAD